MGEGKDIINSILILFLFQWPLLRKLENTVGQSTAYISSDNYQELASVDRCYGHNIRKC